MSQFIVFNPIGAGGGGPILTIQGNTGGLVSPSGAGNINIVMPDPYVDGTATDIYGQGEAVGNLVANTVSLQPYVVATVQSTDEFAENLWVLPIAASSSVTFFGIINAVSADFTKSVSGYINGGVVRDAVNPAEEVGSSFINFDKNGAAGATIDIDVALSLNDLEVNVTGEAGVTYNWRALIYFVYQQ